MEHRIAVGDVTLRVLDEGSGPAVVLLHGFPDSAHLWRHQIAALVAAGYRAIAPDLRGFGESDKPVGTEHYRLRTIAGDVLGILDALKIERAHLVGHDWGAGLGWLFVTLHPDRVGRFAALAVGHPAALRATRSIAQRQRSWYMLLFQFAGVAEELLVREDWKMLREFAPGAVDAERYAADLARPGALTAALEWYRANVPPAAELHPLPALPPVAVPTLGLWSTGDPYLLEEQMVASARFVAGPWRYERVEAPTHWFPLDVPDRVNALLLDFLGPAAKLVP